MIRGTEQLTTFYVGKELFGIEVMKVQEVTGTPYVVPVPLSPPFVRGLVNLRGQIATALGLRELFNKEHSAQEMSVVCRLDGNLVSLIVDSIGDVLELDKSGFESTPDSIPLEVRKYIKGVYKMDGAFLSVIDLDILTKELSPIMELTGT